MLRLGLNRVYVKFNPPGLPFRHKVDVRFIANRFSILMRHTALDQVNCILHRIFPSPPRFKYQVDPSSLKDDILNLDHRITLNLRQRLAVEQIMRLPPPPVRFNPFILFGPPGTGKTTTLVMAVIRLLKASPAYRILVTAPSNAACDAFTDKLIASGAITWPALVRFVAQSRLQHSKDVKENVARIISASKQTASHLLEARVVVTTLACAGKLMDLGYLAIDEYGRKKISHMQFSHVIVDEAGQADESETIIGLVFPFARNARWILAGDPRQLGPVIMSNLAKFCGGMDISMLERLMRCPLYDVGHRDHLEDHVVQLVDNYRSHPGIIAVPSTLFYGNSLRAMSDRSSLLSWKELRGAKVPMLARHVAGLQDREASSPSWFNGLEARTVVEYIVKLINDPTLQPRVFAKDIVVISPYTQQVRKIRHLLECGNLSECRVGTVEIFQGQESRVVILSTVRSSLINLESDVKFDIGFLKHAKRFNVAVTRAKELSIFCGNLDVLKSDVCWLHLLKYCKSLGRVTR